MRYFSWIEEGRWSGNCLLPKGQIANLLQHFRWRYPVFCSTQTYDRDGKIISCPLYFDIDGDSKEGHSAHFMAKEVVKELEDRYETTPNIFFSGNKGYHVIMPVEIEHPQCHYVVRAMVQCLGCKGYSNIDNKVYRNRAMFRVNKSPASRDGFYKIQLSRADLFDHDMETHRQFATSNTHSATSDFKLSQFNQKRWDEDIETAKKCLNYEIKELSKLEPTEKKARPFTPCLASLISEVPEKGDRHSTVFLLARWAVIAGFDETATFEWLTQHQHWKDYEAEEKGISKNIRSVYKPNVNHTLGCRFQGTDRDLMKRFCDPLCEYNDDWSFFK